MKRLFAGSRSLLPVVALTVVTAKATVYTARSLRRGKQLLVIGSIYEARSPGPVGLNGPGGAL